MIHRIVTQRRSNHRSSGEHTAGSENREEATHHAVNVMMPEALNAIVNVPDVTEFAPPNAR